MPSSEPKEWIDSTQPASIAGISAGCGLSAQCLADLALQAERLGIGRQQQLDRRGVEADAVVEALHAVLGIDALDRHHGHQHLDLADLRRVAREQRLDEVRPRRLDDEVTQSAGMSMRGNVDVLPSIFVDLRDHDAARERGGLDDGRRVLGVRAGVEVALGVGRVRGNQRDLGRQVDEVAGEQLEVGVNRADLDAPGRHQPGQARALRPRETEVELRGDAVLEEVEMLRQRQHRLHHVQVVHSLRIDLHQRPRKEVGLLLVVAFEADAVAGLQHGVE